MPTENIYITGQNVTASSDANIILSLGGTPSGAALEPFSINVSWNGQLSNAKGGTGLNGIGTSLQLLRTNAAATALEYFTPSTSDIAEGSNLYFTESRVRNTTLTGLNITGTSITSADSILTAFGKVQNQINSLIGGVNYQGTWNATTNSPALASGVGTKGYYYVVSVSGSTNLDGITDWKLGDWAIFNGATWEKVDNTDAVVSVNGYTGTVVLAKADLGLGNVENIALSTWAGTANITTVGTITSGTWNASILGKAYGGTGVNISTTALTLGTASANNGSIVFQNSNNANTVTLVSGATSSSYSLTLPLAQGGASTVLTNNGAGVLSWSSPSSGITIGTTTITGGATGLILYQKSDGTVQASELKYASPTSTYAPATITVGSGVNHVIKFVNAGGRQLMNLEEGVALGELASVYTSFTTHKVAIGQSATATGGQSTAIGALSSATQTNSLVLGYAATSTAANQCVIGAAAAAGGAGVYDNIYFNGVAFASPAIVTLRNAGASGSNQTSSAYFRIIPSLGTGTGVGSYLTIWTGDAGVSGSTLNTPTEKARLVQGGDLVLGITSDTKGLVLKSSDGHYWRITISTLGVLSTADLGTSIPT